jgi:lipoprotein-releasing system ATP-binding protein
VLGSNAVGALRGVDFSIAKGEFVAVMGPSGCGKTTLLNLVGGIDVPSRGSVWVDGVEISRLSDDELTDLRRDRLGYVFQFYNLIPTLTARENVETPMQFRGKSKSERRERAAALLSRVGLGDRADHKPSELSGGEQQRVAIARAVANAPLLLLADEPTGNLDPVTASYVFEALGALVKQSGLAALIATHNHELASRMDRRVTLADGKVVPL